MPISANELRTARRVANLTQAELAEKIGVSKRTVVNWERDGAHVPARSETRVAEALEASAIAADAQNKGGTGDSGIVQAGLRRALSRFEEDGNAGVQSLADVIRHSVDAVALAEAASVSGAHPLNVIKLLEATMSVVAETGGLGIPEVSERLINEVLIRSGDVGRRAVEEFRELNRDPQFVSMNAERQLGAKLGINGFEAMLNVGGVGQDVESGVEVEIPENVEEVWGLAAHPKTDAPEDHTP